MISLLAKGAMCLSPTPFKCSAALWSITTPLLEAVTGIGAFVMMSLLHYTVYFGSRVFLATQTQKVGHCVHISPSILADVIGSNHLILNFLNVEF